MQRQVKNLSYIRCSYSELAAAPDGPGKEPLFFYLEIRAIRSKPIRSNVREIHGWDTAAQFLQSPADRRVALIAGDRGHGVHQTESGTIQVNYMHLPGPGPKCDSAGARWRKRRQLPDLTKNEGGFPDGEDLMP